MSDFEITGCHANRAGVASVTLRHTASGAMVAIHHVAFQHTPGSSDDVECDRIRLAAAELGRAAVAFLEQAKIAAPIIPVPLPGT